MQVDKVYTKEKKPREDIVKSIFEQLMPCLWTMPVQCEMIPKNGSTIAPVPIIRKWRGKVNSNPSRQTKSGSVARELWIRSARSSVHYKWTKWTSSLGSTDRWPYGPRKERLHGGEGCGGCYRSIWATAWLAKREVGIIIKSINRESWKWPCHSICLIVCVYGVRMCPQCLPWPCWWPDTSSDMSHAFLLHSTVMLTLPHAHNCQKCGNDLAAKPYNLLFESMR